MQGELGHQRDRLRGQVVGIFMLRPTTIHVYAPVSEHLSRETRQTSATVNILNKTSNESVR